MQQYEGEYLEILDIPAIFGQRYGIIPRIYIRHCYRRLYEIITDQMLNDHRPFPVTLFTGVPGIGKSLFLIYFLFMLISDDRFPDKRFAVEFSRGEYDYFEPTDELGIFKRSSRTTDTCPLTDIPIFADISDKKQPRTRGKSLFIFSSPDPRRYHEIIKNSPSFRYTFPTWSFLELSFIDPEDKNWLERFLFFGGVPRNIFWDGLGENPKNKFEASLVAKGATIAEYFFKKGFGDIDSQTSYMFLHINPRGLH